MKSSPSVSISAERITRARIDACGSASATAGSASARSPAQSPACQPGKPPAETQRSFTAKTRTSSMANQKFGTATPSWVAPITADVGRACRGGPRPRCPTGKAIAVESASAISASGSETCSRSSTMPATGVR